MTARTIVGSGCMAMLTAVLCWAQSGPADPKPPALWVDASSGQSLEDGTKAAPFKTVAKALAQAPKGSVVWVKSGEYRENIVVADVTLRGEGGGLGRKRPVIRAANPAQPVAIVRGKVTLELLRITGGEDGILVDLNAEARIVRCEIVDNTDNGIAFEEAQTAGEEPAQIHVENCLVSGNDDGIDLEANKGTVVKCRLINNRDDGLDYDGDADCSALDNEIHDNEDDGIEIRLERTTRARIEGNVITGNGEDGIEIINTPLSGPTSNRVTIAKNRILGNVRYGIGGVDQVMEDLREGLLVQGVTLKENTVEKNGKGQVVGVATPSNR